MPYSLDLRKKVIEYVEAGGSITKASRIYKIGRASVYRWLNRADLSPTQVKRRHRKLDWKALKKVVFKSVRERGYRVLDSFVEQLG